ncbi:DJ-1/PfpI family protein [Cohaesibacter sp. ES.047]|uniref:DJ-1/PfpI family protein n=1 Tax=Cohaesibacter sp. ES.047 TaxID=1798205 RepID=UPI001561A371|nr:DJ-1/PfpI family protein [Cohaesibacter sp. ES.047]
MKQLTEAGATVHVATLDGEAIGGWKASDWGDRVEADLKISDVNVEDYICLVLPGGQINPDIFRTDKVTVQKVRDFVANDKIVAAICHAPWLLIEAGVVEDREMTSYHSIRTDLKNAGDLNAVPWEASIERFQRIGGLIDPRDDHGYNATYDAQSPWMLWPLDHVFHQKAFTVDRFEVLRSFGSDHYPVEAVLCHKRSDNPPPRLQKNDISEAKKDIRVALQSGNDWSGASFRSKQTKQPKIQH